MDTAFVAVPSTGISWICQHITCALISQYCIGIPLDQANRRKCPSTECTPAQVAWRREQSVLGTNIKSDTTCVITLGLAVKPHSCGFSLQRCLIMCCMAVAWCDSQELRALVRPSSATSGQSLRFIIRPDFPHLHQLACVTSLQPSLPKTAGDSEPEDTGNVTV